ncbi:MAG: Rieske (2Fe-2S) protein [Nitrospinota bacterium]|jgi:nitrite reductase/ring-hydroxylating ferredoxin subunit
MKRYSAGKAGEIPQGERLLVEIGGFHIGIFHLSDGFFALENFCPHQKGPVCPGNLFREVTEVGPDGRVRERYAREEYDIIACPMHGWEFDLRTGSCLADRRRKVKTFPVEIEGGEVYVLMPK